MAITVQLSGHGNRLHQLYGENRRGIGNQAEDRSNNLAQYLTQS